LEDQLDLKKRWLRFLKCPRCSAAYFLEVADSKFIYPLQRLDTGAARKLKAAGEAEIDAAVTRIRRIDHKTVSIVEFEQTLLGSHNPERSYRVIYPDGSEA